MLRLFDNSNVTIKTADEKPEVEKRLDIGKLNEVTRCFPIGKKIRYFPEFQSQLTLDSIIIAVFNLVDPQRDCLYHKYLSDLRQV